MGIMAKSESSPSSCLAHAECCFVHSKRSATIIQKTVTDFKAFNQDHLAKVKHLGAGLHGLPDKHSFGMSTVKAPTEWGTKECIEGNRTIEEQMPDPDLGKTLQPGWRTAQR